MQQCMPLFFYTNNYSILLLDLTFITISYEQKNFSK